MLRTYETLRLGETWHAFLTPLSAAGRFDGAYRFAVSACGADEQARALTAMAWAQRENGHEESAREVLAEILAGRAGSSPEVPPGDCPAPLAAAGDRLGAADSGETGVSGRVANPSSVAGQVWKNVGQRTLARAIVTLWSATGARE